MDSCDAIGSRDHGEGNGVRDISIEDFFDVRKDGSSEDFYDDGSGSGCGNWQCVEEEGRRSRGENKSFLRSLEIISLSSDTTCESVKEAIRVHSR